MTGNKNIAIQRILIALKHKSKLLCEFHSFTETLVVVPTSQSSALQRSGRAGRIWSGKSRLYTEESFQKLLPSTVPEMQHSNMAPVVLQLKALGVDNILRFNFLSVIGISSVSSPLPPLNIWSLIYIGNT